MTKSCIYYTDNRLSEPMFSIVQELLLEANLPIISVSLKPINFGKNIVLDTLRRSYTTMITQILVALESSTTDYVFFCEHDVLYDKSHFDFVPPRDDIFYYNSNVWRWLFGSKTAIRHDRMLPLSSLCANRKLALNHYRIRVNKIVEVGLHKFQSKEPKLARIWGYEPGTKKKKRGGLTDDNFDVWQSKYPLIDIRHKWTFSGPKTTLDSFKHLPQNWQEINIDDIPRWDLRKMFNLQ